MKTLVVYYSYEGSTKLAANKVAESLGADILEIKPVNEKKTKGFMKYVWGGRAAVMKHKPTLEPYEANIADYDLIIMGTPVWASTYAPPFHTFLFNNSLENKKVALFCCHEGSPGKTFTHFKKNLQNSDVLGEYDIRKTYEDSEVKLQNIADWAKSLS